MIIPHELSFEKIFVQKIDADWLHDNEVQLSVLRLDKIHPIISGNKFFKLKYYLKDAADKGFSTIATFGGAYSNHVIATAFACKNAGFKSVGIIRGENLLQLSHTLLWSKEFGMELHFVNRTDYLDKNNLKKNYKNIYFIEDGGFGMAGAKGASEIINFVDDFSQYSHVVSAVGTGTTLAGIIRSSLSNQKLIGISVMKNNFSLHQQVQQLLSDEDYEKNFEVMHDFHFHGYAKHNKTLINFMNEVYVQHQLPTDFVYTAKTFFAIKQLIIFKQIKSQSNVLLIHTGGLQGNLSLPKNTLKF